MELICPSCGAKHRTEDYPGAFEILCACGYSILVPDVQAFDAPLTPAEEAPGFSHRAPIADEEADLASAIPLPPTDGGDVDPLQPIASELTPGEQLPDEMIYDPFELQQASAPAPDASGAPVPDATEDETAIPSTAAAPEKKVEKGAEPKTAARDSATKAPPLLERTQRASLGQLIGRSFDVRCHTEDRQALVMVADRCRRLVKGRPWLEDELRRRGVELESLADKGGIEDLPEILAVEFFLACTEAGGRCEFQRRTEAGSDPDPLL